tara:strand:+ start:1035 stop:1232 length:198 start_codon:yes stop_codon:yes gene_type:complete
MKIESEIPYNQHQEDREFIIETPIGSVKSDSGNHFVDVISVVGVIAILYIGKNIMGKYFSLFKGE